jgi:hypothetical protein
MKMAVAFVLAMVGSVASAADYPKNPDDRDELCEEIGGSGKSSAAPADLLWFSQYCTCDDVVGCGYPNSPRFARRRGEIEKADARRLDAERQAAARRDADVRKEAVDSCGDWVGCLRKQGSDAPACAPDEARFEYDCSSGLRDFEACAKAIEGMRRTPAQADCAGALRESGPAK